VLFVPEGVGETKLGAFARERVDDEVGEVGGRGWSKGEGFTEPVLEVGGEVFVGVGDGAEDVVGLVAVGRWRVTGEGLLPIGDEEFVDCLAFGGGPLVGFAVTEFA